jgi:hypothetical protein
VVLLCKDMNKCTACFSGGDEQEILVTHAMLPSLHLYLQADHLTYSCSTAHFFSKPG